MKNILNRLTKYQTLSKEESKQIIIDISEGKLNNSQISSFLTVYIMRNITLDELEGFREALLDLCIHIDLNQFDAIDLCGTGGDGKDTFNISTLVDVSTLAPYAIYVESVPYCSNGRSPKICFPQTS